MQKAFENIVRKEVNSGKQHFLLFIKSHRFIPLLESSFICDVCNEIDLSCSTPFSALVQLFMLSWSSFNYSEKKPFNTHMKEWKYMYYAAFCKTQKHGIGNFKLFTTQFQHLTTLYRKPFENIVGKGENAGNQHFLLFSQCFLPFH